MNILLKITDQKNNIVYYNEKQSLQYFNINTADNDITFNTSKILQDKYNYSGKYNLYFVFYQEINTFEPIQKFSNNQYRVENNQQLSFGQHQYFILQDQQIVLLTNIDLDFQNNILIKTKDKIQLNEFVLGYLLYEPIEEQFVLIVENTQEYLQLTTPNFLLETHINPQSKQVSHNYQSLIQQNFVNDEQINFSIQNINIDFSLIQNFVHFGSAYYRMQALQTKINNIYQYSNNTINPLLAKKEITNIIDTFDQFETFYYYKQIKKDNDGKIIINDFNSLINQLKTTALQFDQNNINSILNLLPSFISQSQQYNQYKTFVIIIGNHFDNIWSYIKNLYKLNLNQQQSLSFISQHLMIQTAKKYGIDLKNDYSFVSIKDWFFSDTDTNESVNDYKKTIWKRIINTLPFIFRKKGTDESIYQILNCFGIPRSIIQIQNYNRTNTTQSNYYLQKLCLKTYNTGSTYFQTSGSLVTGSVRISLIPKSIQNQTLFTIRDTNTVFLNVQTVNGLLNINNSQSIKIIPNKQYIFLADITETSGSKNICVSQNHSIVLSSWYSCQTSSVANTKVRLSSNNCLFQSLIIPVDYSTNYVLQQSYDSSKMFAFFDFSSLNTITIDSKMKVQSKKVNSNIILQTNNNVSNIYNFLQTFTFKTKQLNNSLTVNKPGQCIYIDNSTGLTELSFRPYENKQLKRIYNKSNILFNYNKLMSFQYLQFFGGNNWQTLLKGNYGDQFYTNLECFNVSQFIFNNYDYNRLIRTVQKLDSSAVEMIRQFAPDSIVGLKIQNSLLKRNKISTYEDIVFQLQDIQVEVPKNYLITPNFQDMYTFIKNSVNVNFDNYIDNYQIKNTDNKIIISGNIESTQQFVVGRIASVYGNGQCKGELLNQITLERPISRSKPRYQSVSYDGKPSLEIEIVSANSLIIDGTGESKKLRIQ